LLTGPVGPGRSVTILGAMLSRVCPALIDA
jgi:hypothetical protein